MKGRAAPARASARGRVINILSMLPAAFDRRTVLDAVWASAQAYRAFRAGADFAAHPERYVVLPQGWSYVGSYHGRDLKDFGHRDPVLFGLILRSEAEPGLHLFATRGKVTFRGLWSRLAGPFPPASSTPAQPVPPGVRLEGRLLEVYRSMQAELVSHLDALGPRRVLLAGHSMGGALAQLFALDLALSRPDLPVSTVVCGSPKPGNRAFARTYEQFTAARGNPTLSIVNPFDVIPTLPPTALFGFASVGQPYSCAFKERGPLPNPLSRHRVDNYYRSLCQRWGVTPPARGLRAPEPLRHLEPPPS